ncbi:unnamed protein product, partial [Mesorhabditis spiculigera]
MNGSLHQATLLIQNLKEGEVVAAHPEIQPGGHWAPTDCKALYKVAVIIPYRDRQSHLTRLLNFLIPVLQKQRLDFRFIVTEQWGNDLFNKGRIMNAAFQLAEKLAVDCVIFHDVDMFPQDDRNPYTCPPTPRHIGAFVSNLGYQLWYKEIVGGVLAIRMRDYRAVNGYSNKYWAWGGEDDDMGKRILSLNYTIERPEPATGRFSMLKHVKRKRTAPKLIYKLLEDSDKRVPYDGLNETNKWSVVKLSVRPLYYHIREPRQLAVAKDPNASKDKQRELVGKYKPTANRNIILIRHGQYVMDSKEKSLSDLGRKQAELLAGRLAITGIKFDALHMSPLNRATETADILLQKLPPDLVRKMDPMLEEGPPYPPEPAAYHWVPSTNEFVTDGMRIEAAFRKYFHRASPRQTDDSTEIFVCHSNVIRYFVCRALQFPPEGWLRLSVANCSITWLQIRPNGRVTLKSLSDVGHLPHKKVTFG